MDHPIPIKRDWETSLITDLIGQISLQYLLSNQNLFSFYSENGKLKQNNQSRMDVPNDAEMTSSCIKFAFIKCVQAKNNCQQWRLCQQKSWKTVNAASMLSYCYKQSLFLEMNYDHRDSGLNLNSYPISWKYIFLHCSGEQFVLNMSAHQRGIVISGVNIKFASLLSDSVFRKVLYARWWTVSWYTLTEHILIWCDIAIAQSRCDRT